MTTETNPRAALYKKIAAVTAAIKRVPKSGKNTYFHYDYAMEGDVVDALRGLLAENNLAVLPPTVLTWERGDPDAKGQFLTRVQYQFGLGDCETGETFESTWWAEAQDNADKSFNKAATSGLKYWLLKSFLVSTGDDANDDPDHGPVEPRDQAAPSRSTAQRPQASSAPSPSVQNNNLPQCPTHHRSKEGKDGGYYCPTKLEDNTYCKWRSAAPAPAQPSPADLARRGQAAPPKPGPSPVVPPTGTFTAEDLPFDDEPSKPPAPDVVTIVDAFKAALTPERVELVRTRAMQYDWGEADRDIWEGEYVEAKARLEVTV